MSGSPASTSLSTRSISGASPTTGSASSGEGHAAAMSSSTLRYMAGRIAWLLVVQWAVTTITFVLIFVIPSDPVRAIVGGHAPASVVATIRRQYGFDAPVLVQYGRFWGRLVQGN